MRRKAREVEMTFTALNPKLAKVLVVEDSPDDQAIVSRALKTFGIRHKKITGTASEALDEASRTKYDVALIDYYLPGMNGLDLFRHLTEISPDTSVIVMSGAHQTGLGVSAMKLGAYDYISKDDFFTSKVISTLQAALRARNSEAAERIAKAGSVNEEIETEMSRASWLMSAHGYTFPRNTGESSSAMTPDLTSMFENYILEGCLRFPEAALEQEASLIRACVMGGLSPGDILSLYVAVLFNLGTKPDRLVSVPPSLFLTSLLMRLLEEYQGMLSASNLQAGPVIQADNGSTAPKVETTQPKASIEHSNGNRSTTRSASQ